MKSIIEKFMKFEEENGLFERTYKGIYYWHLIRTWVYYSILNGTSDYDNLGDKQGGVFHVLRKMVTIVANCIINLKQFPYKKNRCDILFSNTYDYRKVNDKYKDIFIDFLTIDNTMITRKFEYNDQLHISKRADISSCYSDLKMILHYSFYKLKKVTLTNNEQIFLRALVKRINQEFGVKLSEDVFISRMLYSITIWESYYSSMKNCLRKLNPRIVVIVGAYGLRHFATVKAAKDLGIITAELQHGSIAPWHIDYNFTDLKNSIRYFPDYIFTFGEYWNGAFKNPVQSQKVAVGYAYMDYIYGQQEEMTRELDTIVFYSSKEIKFAEFVGRFADLIRNTKYKIIFKYHPTECGKVNYTCLHKQNIQVIDKVEEVHMYLSKYEHHVSIGSTVLFEAAMRGASIYVLDEPGKEFVEDLLNSGYGWIISDENELFQRVSNFDEAKNIDAVKLLLKKNANENINKELLKMLGGKREASKNGR